MLKIQPGQEILDGLTDGLKVTSKPIVPKMSLTDRGLIIYTVVSFLMDGLICKDQECPKELICDQQIYVSQ